MTEVGEVSTPTVVELTPKRVPVELQDGKFARAVIQNVVGQVAETDAVKLVLGAYIDGAGLQGAWKLSLEVQRVVLVPVEEVSGG